MTRTPVYFVSHGSPSTMYDTTHPAYSKMQDLGREITTSVKPAAVVVFSAHWQAENSNTIEVNVSESEPLLYDFYGFPKHYYMEKLQNRGSREVAQEVLAALSGAGIKTVEVERGLDHGVFVPFKVMFGEGNHIDVPIVQVSLFEDDTNAEAHIKLGRAVEKLREENILIIVSGMALPNLRDMQAARAYGRLMPYAVPFDNALKEAAEQPAGSQRDEAMIDLLRRPDARKAHPTFEHLLPAHVGVGAAGGDPGKQIWTFPETSMSWAQYRWGRLATASAGASCCTFEDEYMSREFAPDDCRHFIFYLFIR
ncbi:hypothetical protein LTR66_017035 [Elasticomyces elasticus]|nr:hypothetical protein LTR66_017035 [Elasticomyces elasticus]